MLSAPPLLVYPAVWARSIDASPRSWQDQFRVLCGLAKAFVGCPTNGVMLALAGDGERMLLRALAEIDVERGLLTMFAAFPGENPMRRLDPGGVGLAVPAAAQAQPP